MTYEDEADVEEATYPDARILVTAEGQSDGGRIRRRNEDNFLLLPERSLFVVADGMGGYAGGDVASALAVETLGYAFETSTFEGKTESAESLPRRGREMACAIQMVNQAILARAEAERPSRAWGPPSLPCASRRTSSAPTSGTSATAAATGFEAAA